MLVEIVNQPARHQHKCATCRATANGAHLLGTLRMDPQGTWAAPHKHTPSEIDLLAVTSQPDETACAPRDRCLAHLHHNFSTVSTRWKPMTAPFADNPLRMSICLFFRALYTLRSSQIISNKQPCIHALKKAFMGMANHLYSLDILCTDTTRTMTIWPPPGCKQLQAIYDDSRQILWYPNITHKTVPIRHTSYAPGHRTLAVVTLQA